jgi:transcriptional/translational regulatory protein YebC/TACO1
MRCKYHGWEHGCVVNDCIFAPQGPHVVFDKDGSVIYMFSSKHKCSIREKEHAQSKLLSEASDNMEENELDEEDGDKDNQSHPY